jgi:hypothetical protein
MLNQLDKQNMLPQRDEERVEMHPLLVKPSDSLEVGDVSEGKIFWCNPDHMLAILRLKLPKNCRFAAACSADKEALWIVSISDSPVLRRSVEGLLQ